MASPSSSRPPIGSAALTVTLPRDTEEGVRPPISEPSGASPSDLSDEMGALFLRRVSPPPSPGPSARSARVSFAGDDHALLRALTRGDQGAAAALFDRYSGLVERTIARVLGVDSELPDAVQEAFERVLRSVHGVRDPQALPGWVIRIAVCTAADFLRRRRRRRWLLLEPTYEREVETTEADLDGREALAATYAVLDQLSIEDRTVFALRIIDGMELQGVADACDCSLATIKRRLERALARFALLARKHPSLDPWLRDGERWGAE